MRKQTYQILIIFMLAMTINGNTPVLGEVSVSYNIEMNDILIIREIQLSDSKETRIEIDSIRTPINIIVYQSSAEAQSYDNGASIGSPLYFEYGSNHVELNVQPGEITKIFLVIELSDIALRESFEENLPLFIPSIKIQLTNGEIIGIIVPNNRINQQSVVNESSTQPNNFDYILVLLLSLFILAYFLTGKGTGSMVLIFILGLMILAGIILTAPGLVYNLFN